MCGYWLWPWRLADGGKPFLAAMVVAPIWRHDTGDTFLQDLWTGSLEKDAFHCAALYLLCLQQVATSLLMSILDVSSFRLLMMTQEEMLLITTPFSMWGKRGTGLWKKTVETPHKALNIKEENTFFTFTPRTFLQFLLLHVLWTRVLWNIAGLISESMGRKLRSLAASPCQTESVSYPVAQLCEDTPMRRHS